MEAAVTTYGERNAQAPPQLDLFSFLIGKWAGTGKARLQDGTHVEFELTWIGRYILNGMAIADEMHSLGPDGKPYLGISLRHFNAQQRTWIVEFLNVSHSFLRRQVNAQAGSVSVNAGTVAVICGDSNLTTRENYRAVDPNHFTFSMDTSRDGGRSWDVGSTEMSMTRVD
jgi:hypothetical protein